jgi:spore coat polysaccharide biosynthesis predicted glycosyltransferase SpsG
MRFVFRASASKELGSGHVMRLLPLADAFITEGLQVRLIFDIHDLPWLEKYLFENGYSKHLVNESLFLPSNFDDVLIVDSYTLLPNHAFLNSSRWRFIVAILDEQSPHYEASLYIHPGLSDRKLVWAADKLLFGSQYLLVRNSIKRLRKGTPESEEGSGKYAVIAGGGSDPNRFVNALSNYLQVSHPLLKLHLFVDSTPQRNEEIYLHQHPIGSDYEFWLSNASWAFLPSSTMAFESLAMGIPTAIAQCVENQKENYDQLSGLRWATPIGFWHPESGWKFDGDSIKFFLSPDLIQEPENLVQSNPIDFKGANRIMDEILFRVRLEN